MSQLQCIVVTPESTVCDLRAEFVVLPLYDGELGVAPKHSPLIGRLGYGELRIDSGGQRHRFYVDGGFVQIADDLVTVLTHRAVAATALEIDVLREQLSVAQSKQAHSPELIDQRERHVDQLRAQLRLAKRAAG